MAFLNCVMGLPAHASATFEVAGIRSTDMFRSSTLPADDEVAGGNVHRTGEQGEPARSIIRQTIPGNACGCDDL